MISHGEYNTSPIKSGLSYFLSNNFIYYSWSIKWNMSYTLFFILFSVAFFSLTFFFLFSFLSLFFNSFVFPLNSWWSFLLLPEVFASHIFVFCILSLSSFLFSSFFFLWLKSYHIFHYLCCISPIFKNSSLLSLFHFLSFFVAFLNFLSVLFSHAFFLACFLSLVFCFTWFLSFSFYHSIFLPWFP